ncbi:MAG: 23S rRNA (adenine(2503)-C(2))-methyltransferase RlmN [Kiritimatiellia bacterium]|jgi:23S rRNA (adenine2503-C2)-methyltransferase
MCEPAPSTSPAPEAGKRLAYSQTPADWTAWLAEKDIPRFRAKQLWHELYVRRAATWGDMATLPIWLREKLAADFDLEALRVEEEAESSDGVRKLLLACRDGQRIETVLIPARDGRRTVCVSSQVGCAFGCAFCASGQGGCVRSLESGEIVAQAIAVARLLAPANERISNVVVMGMGEPMANYDAVLAALRTLNDPDGLSIGARRITLSTCGVVPGIRRLAEEGLQFELSVSLHAPDNGLRSRLMPVNRRWPLEELLPACREYTEATGRIITFEYTLVGGLNATPEHARRLAALLRGHKCRVNLIPLSPVEEFDGRVPSPRECDEFQRILEAARIHATVRRSRGGKLAAACGQLRKRAGSGPQAGRRPGATAPDKAGGRSSRPSRRNPRSPWN